MGKVHVAVDERLGREVAIKILPLEVARSPDRQARFQREAQAASALNHPGIVTVHDVGNDGGRLYLVMELVDGESLGTVAARGLPLDEALELTAQAADALAAAHA